MSSLLIPAAVIAALIVLSGSASFVLARQSAKRGVTPVAEVFARIALLCVVALLALLTGE